jgi:hypothetical protein
MIVAIALYLLAVRALGLIVVDGIFWISVSVEGRYKCH